jgi:tRNA-Thr(GGU) m(6)t(6)A37 methyltransferase TsaA
MEPFELRPIGRVESPLRPGDEAPRQADETAPEALLVFEPRVAEALKDVHEGDDMLVLTWLDRADRTRLTVHPRSDSARPLTGVFSTRSPHRPNPIGVHRVRILEVDGLRLRVHLEAWDGTPIVDLKPVLKGDLAER